MRFEVQDNGIGIDPDQVGDIFTMFGRARGASVEGAGLGLALCKRIVERLGGRIGVDSMPGRGSTLWFTLPAA